ncbi:radial spoke head protein 9 homolog isoform X3 [Narcine bancroftii]|uniref:radial spoke head protein 9 homolog isoform X3 n=1 Tax=Narcine bancroftii TaxID=1343680 RepID=UPI00383155F4
MQAESLPQHLGDASSQGLVLSPEHQAALQVSLELVRRNYKFNRVYLWGKVLGLGGDYFIVQGVDVDELKSRKTLYSFNCMDWKLLPPATDEMIARSMLIKGRFTGDPSHQYKKTVLRANNEDQTDQDTDIKVKEEERLTATIELINREAAIIPRGAFIMTPRGEVHKNRSFEGLSVTEAGKLKSYLHFTKPITLKKKSVLMQANLEESIDFLNSLEDDELKELKQVFWSLQFERGNKLVILRNLLWPGFTFFHVPDTTQFGFIYMGLGEKNMDFPFMI